METAPTVDLNTAREEQGSQGQLEALEMEEMKEMEKPSAPAKASKKSIFSGITGVGKMIIVAITVIIIVGIIMIIVAIVAGDSKKKFGSDLENMPELQHSQSEVLLSQDSCAPSIGDSMDLSSSNDKSLMATITKNSTNIAFANSTDNSSPGTASMKYTEYDHTYPFAERQSPSCPLFCSGVSCPSGCSDAS